MAVDPTERRSRRALLASAVGGAAAVAAAQLARPLSMAAADPDDVVKNLNNDTTALTAITQTTAGMGALAGLSPDGVGLHGSVTGTSSTWAGVVGTAGDVTGSAFEAASPAAPLDAGVYGYAAHTEYSTGLWGEAPETGYSGVYGTGPTGVEGQGFIGVAGIGDANDPNSIGGLFIGEARAVVAMSDLKTGVHAHVGTGSPPAALATTALLGSVTSTTQIGLEARGRVRLPNRSGRVKMLKGRYYQDFAVSGMTSSNFGYATLATYRSGRSVAAVVCYTGKIRVYLNGRLTADAYVNWIVLG